MSRPESLTDEWTELDEEELRYLTTLLHSAMRHKQKAIDRASSDFAEQIHTRHLEFQLSVLKKLETMMDEAA